MIFRAQQEFANKLSRPRESLLLVAGGGIPLTLSGDDRAVRRKDFAHSRPATGDEPESEERGE
jgi:hypothetical protein